MSAASGFETDVFLSYAHLDNQPLMEGQRGWISSFQATLEVLVGQQLGSQPNVWRDPKLRGNHEFADELTERLTKVAALVSILSPRYVRSEWCTRELQEFWRACEERAGSRLGKKRRVFKVVKTPVPLDHHPEEIRGLLGYEFFYHDREKDRIRELRQEGSPEEIRAYLAKIDDLAQDICRLLEKLRERESDVTDVAEPSTEVTVFLAESTFDVKVEHDRILRALQQRPGYTVLPDRPLPAHGPELREQLREDLARCRLSIHPIGGNYGTIPEAETLSLAEIQNELAAERSSDPAFSRLIWLPPGFEPRDERQRAFIERLRTDSEAQRGAEILSRSIEDLKTVLTDKLHPRAKADHSRPAPAEGDVESVYLICDRRDREAADEVGDALFERGVEVIRSLFEGDESELRRYHKGSLALCDGVLLFYGEATELWLRHKLLDLKKVAGFGRTRQSVRAIYLAPPARADKARFKTHEGMVIRGTEGFSAELLDPFLEQLQAREAG